MLKNLFESIIDGLGLPINFLTEYVLLAIIGEIAYQVAFSVVGKHRLHGRDAKLTHWFVRLFVYLGLWALVYTGIEIYNYVTDNWKIILLSFACITGTVLIAVLSVLVIRFFKKHRTVKNNA